MIVCPTPPPWSGCTFFFFLHQAGRWTTSHLQAPKITPLPLALAIVNIIADKRDKWEATEGAWLRSVTDNLLLRVSRIPHFATPGDRTLANWTARLLPIFEALSSSRKGNAMNHFWPELFCLCPGMSQKKVVVFLITGGDFCKQKVLVGKLCPAFF